MNHEEDVLNFLLNSIAIFSFEMSMDRQPSIEEEPAAGDEDEDEDEEVL